NIGTLLLSMLDDKLAQAMAFKGVTSGQSVRRPVPYAVQELRNDLMKASAAQHRIPIIELDQLLFPGMKMPGCVQSINKPFVPRIHHLKRLLGYPVIAVHDSHACKSVSLQVQNNMIQLPI